MKDSLQDHIQDVLKKERDVWGDDFYEPSPGQLLSHVDYRVAKVAARATQQWVRAVLGL